MAKGAVIGALRVNLGLDSAQFQSGIASASKGMDGMAKKAAAFGARVGIAMTGAAAAIGTFVKMTADSAARTGDVADRFGLAVESLQELRHAAEMSGVGVQNFDMAFRRFLRRASEAARGTGAAKNAFAELGIALTDNQKRMRNSEDIFNDVADAMQKIQDPTNKLRLAFQIFDTDGAAMVKMFENGSAGIKAFREQAQQLGIVLSGDAVRSAQRFNDSLTLIGKLAEGFRNRLFAAVIPAFEHLAARIFDVASNSKVFEGVAAALSGTLNLLARGIGFVLDNLDHLIDLFKIFVGAKIVMYVASVGGAMITLARTIALTGSAMAIFTRITRLKLTTLALLAAVVAKLTGTYEPLVGWIKQTGQALMDALPEGMRSGIESLAGSVSGLFGDINALNTEAARSFGTYLSVSDEIVDSFGKAGEAAKNAAQQMKEMQAEAARIFESTRTPLETYQAQIARLNQLLQEGYITQDTYNRAVLQAQDAFEKAETAGKKTESAFQQIGQTMAYSFSNAFTSIIDGSRKVGDVIADLLKQLANLLMNRAFQMLLNAVLPGSGGMSLNYFPPPPGFANGTNFAPGGMAWVGERGPELINLPRGSQVIPNHELGEGGGGRNVSINVNVSGARGNKEIQEMVASGVRQGIGQYDSDVFPVRFEQMAGDRRRRY